MHIVHFISSLAIGGAERVLCSLIAHLKEQNHKQSVVYIHDGPLRKEIEVLGIKTYAISGYFVRYDPLFVYACIKLIQVLKPDIIHSSLWAANILGIIASKFTNTPIICAVHAQRIVEGTLRNMLDRYILRYANHLTSITHTIKQQLMHDVKIIPSNITVIENGINVKKIMDQSRKSTIIRADLGLKESDFIIGSVGRFVPEKEYPFLLKSVAPLLQDQDHMQLILVGIGPELTTIKSLTRQLKIEHKVHVIVGKQAINYYQLFNCFVLPSTCEGLSLVLLEAMSLKIPCIVRGNHYHEILEHAKHAYIITSQLTLQQAIAQYAEKPDFAHQIARNAYDFVSRSYDENIMLSSYQSLIQKLAKK